jgi:uroporphyrin-III C-methyltransferase / precorrin-2 dehydrogenase / sirohydrochlorin ferrochelatase
VRSSSPSNETRLRWAANTLSDGERNPALFPLFLKLEGKRCLVVGAGLIGLEKVESLLLCGASIRVVAPRAVERIQQLNSQGEIEWLARSFAAADAGGCDLIIAATNDRSVNRAVFEEASRRSILCNTADDPPLCDFFFGSVVRRGELQIAISTAGQSPALAQRLRREIDAQLPADLGPWLEDLGQLRREVLQFMPAGPERKALLHELAHRELCSAAACPARTLAAGAAVKPKAQAGKVYLVGAGPGDPDLLTVKAARLLAEAGVVLHDDLVPQPILNLAGKDALIISVGKRCGRKKITQAAIHELMIESARRGLAVIRLKSGDPMIFGRAAEEIDALREAEVPFEVIPGVTAASSASAYLEASLTDRRVGSKLIILSGHHAARTAPQPELWSGSFPEDATLAIYMPGQDLSQVAASLLASGVSPSMPCVAVANASRPDAVYTSSRLHGLAQLPTSVAPTLLLAGHAFEAVLTRGAGPEDCYPGYATALASAIQTESVD